MTKKMVQRAAKQFWWWLRQITGDAAYENYLAHHRVAPPCDRNCSTDHEALTMTREQFYADSLRRRYSTINRCC